MADDRKDGQEEEAIPTRPIVSDGVVERANNEILFGVGSKRPPRHTQFKKGTTGNPMGRPRMKHLGPLSTQSVNAMALKEGQRMISVREGDEVREISTMEALFRAQTKSALSGSA